MRFQDADELVKLGIICGTVLASALSGIGVAVLVAGPQAFSPAAAAQTRPTLVTATAVVTTAGARETAKPIAFARALEATPTVASQVLAVTVVVLDTPTMTSAPTLLPVPSVTATPQPTPAAAEVWAAVQPELERTWGNETQRTMDLLNGFVARFPDYAPAREKLYAALIASGLDLVAAGDPQMAAELLGQARALIPERGEAAVAALALTPMPSPTSAQVVTLPRNVQPALPTSVLVRARTTSAQPASVVSPPTPTKQPFIPPGG
jgi:hypothetical protein